MHDSIQIEETAAAWLARRDGEEWSAADQAELTAWLEASTAHRVAYIRLEAAWQKARRLKAVAAGVPAAEVPPPGNWTVVGSTVG
jgi:transmembrane sensor